MRATRSKAGRSSELAKKQAALFGANFRAVRQAHGLTILDVHKATGISQAYLGEVERGKANISLYTISYLAEAVGVELPELFRRTPLRARPTARAGERVVPFPGRPRPER